MHTRFCKGGRATTTVKVFMVVNLLRVSKYKGFIYFETRDFC